MDRLREPIPTTPQNITDPTKEHHILKKVCLSQEREALKAEIAQLEEIAQLRQRRNNLLQTRPPSSVASSRRSLSPNCTKSAYSQPESDADDEEAPKAGQPLNRRSLGLRRRWKWTARATFW